LREDSVTAQASLKDRYESVRQRIASAAQRSGRQASDIYLVAVTKYAEQDDIRALIDLGHQDFGENRVQQLAQRAAMAEEYLARRRVMCHTRRERGEPEPPEAIRWHMIGHLQRNKARKAVETCRLIHSVDSLRLAEELQQLAMKLDVVSEVLIQVNCSEEPQKYGCPIAAAIPLAEQMDSMINLRVRGLMTMAAFDDDPQRARPVFSRCRELFEEIRDSDYGEGSFNLLSMGMSGDFEVAIEEGSNLVRVGSAIFGERAGSEDPDEGPESD
jgi:PLP dependent protein